MGVVGGIGSLVAAAVLAVPVTIGAALMAVGCWAEEAIRDLVGDGDTGVPTGPAVAAAVRPRLFAAAASE